MDLEVGSHRNRIYQVTDLEPETIRAVAERTAEAETFSDLIYRESEVDAMWTLVDIQVRQAEINDLPTLPGWIEIRRRLWEAHDFIPEGHVKESAAMLHSIVDLVHAIHGEQPNR